MKAKLNIDRIAKGLRAEPKGKFASSGGYFGALQLVADVKARFRVPPGGGRPTDPDWTVRRVLPLKPRTLKHLEKLTAKIRSSDGIKIEVMQFAAIVLERRIEQLSWKETRALFKRGQRKIRSATPV